MKKFVIQAVILIAVIFGSLALSFSDTSRIPFIPQPQKSGEVYINEIKVKTEVADTAQKRAKGLGDRESLASDSGMLFIFDESKKYSFWMKGLKFPLDLIWIKSNQVVDIIKNVPPPEKGQSDESLPVYQPTEIVDMVLEVNGGFTDANNIKAGDKVMVIIK